MVISKKTFILALIILTLSITEAHARFQTPQIEQPYSLYSQQMIPDAEISTLFYQKLRHLLGERLYTYLLESDDFLKLQDLTASFIEKSYPVAHPRKQP